MENAWFLSNYNKEKNVRFPCVYPNAWETHVAQLAMYNSWGTRKYIYKDNLGLLLLACVWLQLHAINVNWGNNKRGSNSFMPHPVYIYRIFIDWLCQTWHICRKHQYIKIEQKISQNMSKLNLKNTYNNKNKKREKIQINLAMVPATTL